MEDKKPEFAVSLAAVSQIKRQLDKQGIPSGHLRLGIKGGGCSGYSYVILFEDKAPNDEDHIFNFDDITVIIDKKSMIYLNGSLLDWQHTLMYKGFKFVNPNEKSRCGCGNSFSA